MEQYLPVLLLGTIFLSAGLFFLFIFFLFSESNIRKRRAVRKRLLYISAGGKHGLDRLNLYRSQALKKSGGLDRLILKLPRISGLDRLLIRSGIPLDVPSFVSLTLILGLCGGLLGYFLLGGGAILLGVMGVFLPYFYLKVKERKFMNKFNEQLPETIDLLARALRAGHALTSGFDMVAKEVDEPSKSEFGAMVDEIKMGLSLKEALDNLCRRVSSRDLNFLAVAILLQKETGGNLTEILDKTSHVVRERIQFKRQVQTLSAEGRLSGRILLILPVVMFTYIYFVNYEYISLLWTQKTGYLMLTGGIFMMLMGAISIKKITRIEL